MLRNSSLRVAGAASLLIAASFTTSDTQAADLPVKAPYLKTPVVMIYDWTGFYIGANAGVGMGRDYTRNVFQPGPPVAEASYINPQGAVAGGQVGYNWQLKGSNLLGGNLVLGVEADIQGTGMHDDHTCGDDCITNLPLGPYNNYSQRLDWFGTVRGRVGIASGPVLSYITAGFAYGGVKTTLIDVLPQGTGVFSTDRTQGGWAWGSGVEASLGGNWTGKIEYLWLSLGGRLDTFTLNTFPHALSTDIREQVFRVGLNYRVGGSNAAYVPPPASNWAGFYLGGNLGSGTARDPSSFNSQTVTGRGSLTALYDLSPDGVIGGVQGGYNWQSANWVFGVEADIQGSSQRDNRACVLQCSTTGTPPLFVTYDATLPWFGTARARIGYSVGSTLFYGTAGYAYGSVKSSYHVQLGTENASPVFSETKGGWTAGAGIEAPFTFLGLFGPNWTAKAEYLYVDLGTATNTFIGQATPVAFVDTTSTQVREHIFRSGLNYHFNSPVIAKY